MSLKNYLKEISYVYMVTLDSDSSSYLNFFIISLYSVHILYNQFCDNKNQSAQFLKAAERHACTSCRPKSRVGCEGTQFKDCQVLTLHLQKAASGSLHKGRACDFNTPPTPPILAFWCIQ